MCVCECDARESVCVCELCLYSIPLIPTLVTLLLLLPPSPLPLLISWVYVCVFFSLFYFIQKAYLSYDALRFNARTQTHHILHCNVGWANEMMLDFWIFFLHPFSSAFLPSFTKSGIRRNRGSVSAIMSYEVARLNWKCQNVLQCFFSVHFFPFFHGMPVANINTQNVGLLPFEKG